MDMYAHPPQSRSGCKEEVCEDCWINIGERNPYCPFCRESIDGWLETVFRGKVQLRSKSPFDSESDLEIEEYISDSFIWTSSDEESDEELELVEFEPLVVRGNATEIGINPCKEIFEMPQMDLCPIGVVPIRHIEANLTFDWLDGRTTFPFIVINPDLLGIGIGPNYSDLVFYVPPRYDPMEQLAQPQWISPQFFREYPEVQVPLFRQVPGLSAIYARMFWTEIVTVFQKLMRRASATDSTSSRLSLFQIGKELSLRNEIRFPPIPWEVLWLQCKGGRLTSGGRRLVTMTFAKTSSADSLIARLVETYPTVRSEMSVKLNVWA